MRKEKKSVVIVGGGFAGVRTALNLAKKDLQDTKIVLISDKPHFEYHAALYRVVTGRSPLEVCIPLSEIFQGKDVEIVVDEITKIDIKNQKLSGKSGSEYAYGYLVSALGSETSYLETPGLKDLSYGFKSIDEALELKKHLYDQITSASSKSKAEKVKALNLVVVGGGASGTELAGELVAYTRELARKHEVDPSFITVDLVQSPGNLVPKLPKEMSLKVEKQLHTLGVNIFLNRRVVKEELETVLLKDMELKTKTVIWTAGVVINSLYRETKGLKFSKNKRVLVDKYLRAKGLKKVFILGDGAETPYSGMAQTAVFDGETAAENIFRSLSGEPLLIYKPEATAFAIPVGPGWAAVMWKGMKFYGRAGWVIRRLADFRFFLTILSLRKAVLAFWSKGTICTECGLCSPAYEKLFTN